MVESPIDKDNIPTSFEPNNASILQAISTGNIRRATELLNTEDARSLISERTAEGASALHVCAELNDCLAAELLLKHGANMNLRDKERRTPFMVAVQDHSVEVACLLIERGCALGNSTTDAAEALKHSDYSDDYRRMLVSLRTRFSQSTNGPVLLHRAIRENQTHYIRALVEAGFDVNERDEDSIFDRYVNSQHSFVLTANADTAPVHHAIVRGNMTAVKLLVEASADVNAIIQAGPHESLRPAEDRDYSPLLLAASAKPDPAMIRYLIAHGADPNLVLPLHNKIVLQCVCAYDVSIGVPLIEAGSDLNHQSEAGHTPLYWACVCDNPPLLELVLKKDDVNLNIQTHDSAGAMTATHACVQFDRRGPLRMMLEAGPDLSVKDAQGRTPLELAVQLEREAAIDMIKQAEEAPADVDCKARSHGT